MDRKFFDRLIVGVVVLALGVFAAGCGSSKSKSDGGSTADVNSAGLDVNGCKPATQPPAKKVKLKKPSERLDRSRRYTAVFQTNCGEFSVLLDVKRNPKTAASFAYLVKRDVYVNTWFHRIVSDFVAQGGDPLGTGAGDAGYKVTEKPRGKYKINTVAMAKGGNEPPGTSGSQFYIVTGQQGTALPPDYAIAGTVVNGADTIQRIAGYAAPQGAQSETPTGVVVITKATLLIVE
ncbi:MAG: peptidylprolyl isomerase [Thermoleophilia bacterium]|nr:peptidylprolyl isomerase [Thermoleophilia bacterium]